MKINSYNNNYYIPQYTGIAKLSHQVGENTVKSKLFSPITKQYDKLTDAIADNYFGKFCQSNFAKWFATKTKNVKNMTTHMSALGSTLISSMYAYRTLHKEDLDPEKRKTLAINDVLTWGISTAGSYFLDAKLANWWDGVTNRFVANYLLDNPKDKRKGTLGDWDPKNLKEYMEKSSSLVNERIDKINKKITDSSYKGGRRPLEHIEEQAYKSVRDFNLDILKNRRLTTLIDGMGILKSLFVFGMVYRYLVPVLVMKPANWIGAYIHQHNAEKNNTKKS